MRHTAHLSTLAALCIAATVPNNLYAAPITWGAVGTNIQSTDLITSGIFVYAGNGGADGAGNIAVGATMFTVAPITAAEAGTVSNTGNGGFYAPATDDPNLDAILDSHTYISGINPNGRGRIDLTPLTPGATYEIQAIAVADTRGCCATRTQTVEDELGNASGAMARGDGAWVVGTFVADGTIQSIFVTGATDPGLSGLVLIEKDATDSDGDNLPDNWETFYGLNPNSADSDGDGTQDDLDNDDGDGLDNAAEFSAGTDPTLADTDGDSLNDDVEDGTMIWAGVGSTGTNPLVRDSDGDGLEDGVENPDLPFVDAAQTGSDPNDADTDDDSLPDNVEVVISLDPNDTDTDDNGTLDGDEDQDGDGSNNIAELANGTGISDEDSDDDDLLDGVETNTGTWGSIIDTGTDPLDPDSDNDSLSDGVENPDLPYVDANQTGSDPNLYDTDGDLATDGDEVAAATDPSDPDSTSALPPVSTIPGLLGGDLTDPEDDIDDVDPEGSGFAWVGITATSRAFFTDAGDGTMGDEGAFDIFDNKVGGGEAKWCCDPPPQNATVEFADPVSITHFTITSGNDVPDRDPLDFEILGSNDGVSFEPIFTRVDNTSLWNARNQTAQIVLASPSDAYAFIRYEVTRCASATQHQLSEIEYFGTVGQLGGLAITDFEYDTATGAASLTWTSRPGRNYGLYFSFDGVDWGGDVEDNIPSGGDTTTFPFTNPELGEGRVLFRVEETTN